MTMSRVFVMTSSANDTSRGDAGTPDMIPREARRPGARREERLTGLLRAQVSGGPGRASAMHARPEDLLVRLGEARSPSRLLPAGRPGPKLKFVGPGAIIVSRYLRKGVLVHVARVGGSTCDRQQRAGDESYAVLGVPRHEIDE